MQILLYASYFSIITIYIGFQICDENLFSDKVEESPEKMMIICKNDDSKADANAETRIKKTSNQVTVSYGFL